MTLVKLIAERKYPLIVLSIMLGFFFFFSCYNLSFVAEERN